MSPKLILHANDSLLGKQLSFAAIVKTGWTVVWITCNMHVNRELHVSAFYNIVHNNWL